MRQRKDLSQIFRKLHHWQHRMHLFWKEIRRQMLLRFSRKALEFLTERCLTWELFRELMLQDSRLIQLVKKISRLLLKWLKSGRTLSTHSLTENIRSQQVTMFRINQEVSLLQLNQISLMQMERCFRLCCCAKLWSALMILTEIQQIL